MISFKGNPVKSMYLRETYDFIDVPLIRKANFVELNPFDKNDTAALNRVQRIYGNWGQDASLISDIFQYEGEVVDSNIKSRYFALTEQTSEFDKLYPSSILGLAKTTDIADNSLFIDMIQVNPWHIFSKNWDKPKNMHKKYKDCGISIIESIKDIFKNKDLFLHSPKSLISYFMRFGFEVVKSPADKKEDVLMKLSRQVKTGVHK